MLKLVWRDSARNDVHDILGFIAERNEFTANNLQSKILGCVEHLTDHPYIYRTGRVPGTREAVVHPNYVLVYRVGADTVEIVSVMHTRRQYPPGE
ncbi:MAG: type II toxin-antitoxin system RelE/ParE family toxin [Novosphingobium sp.]